MFRKMHGQPRVQPAQLGRRVPVYPHQRLQPAERHSVTHCVGEPCGTEILGGGAMSIVDAFGRRTRDKDAAAERRNCLFRGNHGQRTVGGDFG